MTPKPLIPLDIYWNQVSVKKHVPISFLVCIMCLTQQEERKRKELLRFLVFVLGPSVFGSDTQIDHVESWFSFRVSGCV